MAARIFISYRSADGADKATALARDLGQVFGHEAVFLDKEDLAGGSAWRAEIGHTLQQRPVLLLLMTPQLLGAVGADGRRRIDDPADPVRREFEAALEAGAQVIPVLCDGMSAAPESLPAPFNQIGELTWRKLRAYDWAHDVQRLVADLVAQGVPTLVLPAAVAVPAAQGDSAPVTTRRGALRIGGALLLGAAALVGWWVLRPAAPPVVPVLATPTQQTAASSPLPAATAAPPLATTAVPSAPASSSASVANSAPAATAVTTAKPTAAQLTSDLSGRWSARLWQGERVAVVIKQTGDKIILASEPVPISERADWAEYRQFWRERFGTDLNAVMYRGQGLIVADPGTARSIDVALQVLPSPGGAEPIDGGNLSATLSADGLRLSGKIWKNGAQAEQPATLARVQVQNPPR